VVYWTGYCDCFHHDLKCVLKSVRTYVYFTRLQEENYFCSKNIFTSITLTGDEMWFSFFQILQLNGTTNICTANRGHSDHYRRLHFKSQHTHTHTYICFRKFLLKFLRNFPSPLTEVAGSNFPMSRFCLITKLYSLLFQTTVMNIHIIILRHKAINTHMLISCTI